jgi:AcrR family transcriptional regulator
MTTRRERASGAEGDPVASWSVPTSGVAVEEPRPMRADALRNRSRILETAEEIFAVEGIAVPIDVIAKGAGVGVGTLYRHFPTKEALIEAIVVHRLSNLAEAAKSYADADDPGEALFAYLHEFARQAAAKHDLFDALGSAGVDIKSRSSVNVDEVMACLDRLRQRAVEVGAIRADVASDELVDLVVGVCRGHGPVVSDEDRVQRMVAIVCDGLRPPGPAPE